jgi:hypothetical protein
LNIAGHLFSTGLAIHNSRAISPTPKNFPVSLYRLFPPAANSHNILLIIFPALVFGKVSVKRMSSGLALAPGKSRANFPVCLLASKPLSMKSGQLRESMVVLYIVSDRKTQTGKYPFLHEYFILAPEERNVYRNASKNRD